MLYLPFARIASSSLTPTGTTTYLNGIPYYIPPHSVGGISKPLPAFPKDALFRPVTVIDTTAEAVEPAKMDAIGKKFTEEDDVFQRGFLEGMLIQCN